MKGMLGPLATPAFQSLNFLLVDRLDIVDPNGKPTRIATCAAYGASGDPARMRWPAYHKETP